MKANQFEIMPRFTFLFPRFFRIVKEVSLRLEVNSTSTVAVAIRVPVYVLFA